MPVRIGEPAPGFRLPDQHRSPVSLDDLSGRPTLLVFIPLPFTPTCQGELCAIRDDSGAWEASEAGVCVITCDTTAANRRWAEDIGFDHPILSDYWPHGEVARRYGCFDEQHGIPRRHTFVLDREGVVREIVRSDELTVPRSLESYRLALAGLA